MDRPETEVASRRGPKVLTVTRALPLEGLSAGLGSAARNDLQVLRETESDRRKLRNRGHRRAFPLGCYPRQSKMVAREASIQTLELVAGLRSTGSLVGQDRAESKPRALDSQ